MLANSSKQPMQNAKSSGIFTAVTSTGYHPYSWRDFGSVCLMREMAAVCSSQHDATCPYPLLPSFSARVVLLGKVPQVVVVVEVEKLHEVLE